MAGQIKRVDVKLRGSVMNMYVDQDVQLSPRYDPGRKSLNHRHKLDTYETSKTKISPRVSLRLPPMLTQRNDSKQKQNFSTNKVQPAMKTQRIQFTRYTKGQKEKQLIQPALDTANHSNEASFFQTVRPPPLNRSLNFKFYVKQQKIVVHQPLKQNSSSSSENSLVMDSQIRVSCYSRLS